MAKIKINAVLFYLCPVICHVAQKSLLSKMKGDKPFFKPW